MLSRYKSPFVMLFSSHFRKLGVSSFVSSFYEKYAFFMHLAHSLYKSRITEKRHIPRFCDIWRLSLIRGLRDLKTHAHSILSFIHAVCVYLCPVSCPVFQKTCLRGLLTLPVFCCRTDVDTRFLSCSASSALAAP